jgi:predicted DNA-binding antitoxin AbrB/MazE fold protein
MTIQVEATYENGTLKLDQPLPLKDHEKVHITVRTNADFQESAVERSYGLLGWTGTHEELEQILAEAEDFEDLP